MYQIVKCYRKGKHDYIMAQYNHSPFDTELSRFEAFYKPSEFLEHLRTLRLMPMYEV